MKKMTRREILRQLAGISVLGAVATGVRAAVNGSQPESHLFSIPTRSTSTRPRSVTTTSAARDTSTTVAHAHHAAETTGATETTAAPAETTVTSAQTTTSSSPATTASPATNATTTSAAPQVSVGTSQLSGVLGATTIGAGSVATIVGDIELRGDLVVEGLLTSIDTFTLRGNGYQIEVRNGGQLDLRGIPKSGWVRGAAANGWKSGDRILTAPVEPGRYALSDFHTGSPGSVTMADGRTIAAEQFNLTRSITIDNVSRIMFHMGAGRQVLKHVAVTNSGISGKLAFYPIHFHLNGNTTRGSIVEGVVVENGRFHAFVPHASHGVTFLDCVAFNIAGEAYWWDPPPSSRDTSNDTNDTIWQHCLAAYVVRQEGSNDHRTSAFYLGRGVGNRCIDCTAVAIPMGPNTSGFQWPESGAAVWEFKDCVAHNVKANGIFAWQNNSLPNVVQSFIAYRCGRAGIEHGAYSNTFKYISVCLTDNTTSVISHALATEGGTLLFENVISNNDLVILPHTLPTGTAVVYRRSGFLHVALQEVDEHSRHPGVHEFADCGIQPTQMDLVRVHPETIIRIFEAGLLRWEWHDGSWIESVQ